MGRGLGRRQLAGHAPVGDRGSSGSAGACECGWTAVADRSRWTQRQSHLADVRMALAEQAEREVGGLV